MKGHFNSALFLQLCSPRTCSSGIYPQQQHREMAPAGPQPACFPASAPHRYQVHLDCPSLSAPYLPAKRHFPTARCLRGLLRTSGGIHRLWGYSCQAGLLGPASNRLASCHHSQCLLLPFRCRPTLLHSLYSAMHLHMSLARHAQAATALFLTCT